MTPGRGVGGQPASRPFPRAVLAADTLSAARALLGARLVRDPGPGDTRARAGSRVPRVGRIVEVEAYIGEHDLASHARMGRTARNAVMFGPPGVAYVYLVYGMYHCLNVVTEPAARAAAVLVRAVEPLSGAGAMREARIAFAGRHRRAPDALRREAARLAGMPVMRLAAGPGLVAAAFEIDRSDTGLDLCAAGSPLRLEPAPADEPPPDVRETPRVGIAYAGEPWASAPWRLVVAGSPSLSGPRGAR